MKKIYNCIKILTTILSVFFVQSQDLNWVPASTTGTGSASIAFMSNSILFDGEILLDPNATLGVFYIDENEEYVCGGCLDLDNNGMCDNLATEQSGGSPSYLNGGAFSVPAWGADPGEDNGFESNEIINFFINIDGIDYLANNIMFSSGNDSFVANGLVVISQIEFSSQELETCSCVDPTIVTEISNGNCIIQAPNYCGSDLNSSNFCNISGFVNVIIGTPPTLYQNEAANGFPNEVCGLNPGCTNPDAQNYDPTATSDDGSCLIQGCTNANAINYDSIATSDDGSCIILGCTCSNAINYDSTATNDDSSCVISVGCSDSNAVNYSDDCPDGTFLEENCEYSENCSDNDDAMGQLSCQQAITFFGCEGTWNDNLISDACPESCDTCPASCEDNDDAMGQLTCQQAITFFGCEGTWNDNLISDACPESCNACDTSCEVENIQWEYDVTDGNMTIQIGAEVILLNGESLPNGSLIGAFYTNDNNQLSCAGYLPYEGEQLALPIWGSESGLDNGFAIGESITWLVKVGNQTFSTNNFDMNSSPPFTDTYTPNGFGQILSAEFTCEVSGTLGCTDQNAYNFNNDATIDDGSCYNLDWTVVPTDCNMTILINDPEVVSLDISLNGSEIPPGVTIGVFYENQDGQLVCGGSVEWTGTSTAIPAFGSESGLDNGFQVGEVFENWALLIGDQTIPMDANGATMNSSGFSPSYVCNGFGNLLSVNFEGDFVLTYGCTDETACNFDNSAIIDDGNCSYGQTYYSDSDGDGLGNPSISTVSCNEILDFVTNDDDPCPDNTENPNNSLFWYFDYDGDGLGDESFIPSVAGCNSPGPEWVDNNNDLCPLSSVNDSNGNGICDEEEVLGCTDSNAINFDPSANIDDESCVAVVDGCTDETAFNYNPDANNDDGSCIEVVEGCTDETAFNYNPLANTDDGSCVEIIEGCTDETAFNYNELANTDNGSCIEIVEGCTDETAFNYNPLANTDNDSCIEIVEGCTDENAFNFNELANTDDGSCIEIVEGCTDENAFNYNELANTDDGSCIEVVEGCTDENAFNYNELANTDDGSCIEVVEGCTDETAFNFNPLANTDNDSCIEIVEGCTDETAFNFNELANTDDGSCIEVVEGCTDENAFNYNELANTDDGSCIEVVEGCTDENACNYDVNANVDDNSCYYTDGICESCIEGTVIDNDLDDDGICDADEVVGCQDESACNFNSNATDNCSLINYLANFNGSNNYLEIEHSEDLNFMSTNSFTMSFWANIDITKIGTLYKIGDGYSRGQNRLISISHNLGSINFQMRSTGNGSAQFPDCPNVDEFSTTANVSIDVGESGWYYITIRRKLNDYLSINVNDQYNEVDDNCGVINFIEECVCCNEGWQGEGLPNHYFGASRSYSDENQWGFTNHFEGQIDNIQIWSTILNDSEIQEFSDCPPVGSEDNLELLWTFDDEILTLSESIATSSNAVEQISSELIYNCLTCCTYVPEGETCAGCTDESAFNYNPEAIDDDGSCIPFIYGCMDENACNFSADANTDDGTCIAITTWYLDEDGDGLGFDSGGFFEIISCDEPSDDTFNYVDNGNDPSEGDYDNDLVFTNDDCDDTDENVGGAESGYNCNGECLLDEDEDGICNEFEVPGCTDTSACNYDLSATDDDDSCTYSEEFYDCDGVCLSDIDLDGVCDELEVFGCTDDVACNFNTQATEDDNSCFYIDGICQTCENNQIYDNDEDGDGVCNDDEIPGCTDDSACNFDSLATDDDGSCFYTDGICQTCENGQIIQNDDDGDGVCNDDEILGCTDSNACNFDSLATDDNGSCFYTDGICQSCENGQIIDNDEDGDGVCNNDEILGCTDDSACNFDSLATDDDGSCFYTDGICETCENGQIVDNDEDGDGVCNDDEIPGCTDPNACNFDPELGCTDDDGSCFYSEITAEIIVIDTSCESLCDGEIQLDINNGQPPYTVEYILNEQSIFSGGNLNNACVGNYLILITDALNCELTISATVDFDPSNPDSDGDGVCDSDELLGCTDEAACNFQIEATENDGSCYYCDGFGADIDGDGFDDCLLINADAISNGNNPIYGCEGCINDTDFDGVCDELEIIGCTDDGEQIWSVTPGYPSCTYDSSATEQCDDLDGNGIQDCCEYPTDYYLTCDGNCSDEDINNNFVIDPEEIGNGDIDGDGVCNVLEIEGCQDESACNFNILATDQGECEYADEFYDCDGCILDTDNDGVCDELEIAGCQDGLACNFDPLATDPAECFYLELTTLVDENIQNVSCPGESDGSFTISVFGGNGPYSLYISNLNGAEYNDESQDGLFVVTNVSGGSYDVFISDINTCTTFESVDVEEIDPIDIQISYLNFISCDGGNDGALTNTISGGTPPYEFNWLDGNGLIISEEQDIYNLSAGAYAVQVVDNIGCSNQTTFILSEPNTLDISDVSVTDVSCFGGNDGNVEIDIIGGTPPFTYIFTDEFGSFVNPNSLTAGSYVVYANDSNGCSVNTDFSVSEPGSIDININALNSLICEDDFTTITADEGFESYQWYEVNTGFIFGNNTNTLNVNESGIYSVTATSFDGCEINSSTIEIIVDQQPFFEINGINDVITGNTIIYYSNQNDNVSYEWSIIPSEMGEIISGNGTNEIEIIWGLEGDAQLFLTQTTTNGCENSESIDISISWPFNLNDENEEIDFVVFPNPFSSYTNINVSNPRLLDYSIYLYDANGKIVKSYENINTESIRLNNNFSSGIYNLKLISSEGIKQKLILID